MRYSQTINLEDWSITFKEFQTSRIKQLKKQASKESEEKMELPQPLAQTHPSSDQPPPEVVQPPHDNSMSKNSNAQVIPQELWWIRKRAKIDVMKERVSNVVKKTTMSTNVQQSIS